MRAETYIAQRIYFSDDAKIRKSRPAIKVALAGMIIGVTVMLITVCVVVGFKQTITQQVAGFGAHIQVVSFDNNNTYELQPIVVTDSLKQVLRIIPNVANVSSFATKPGILKTDDAFQGIILKGTDYWDYFQNNLLIGHLPDQPNQVLISRQLADWLKVGLDSSVLCYFVGDDVRVRKFKISGIYRTGFSDFDERFVVGNIEVIRRLNHWDSTQVSGLEILVDNFRNLESVADEVYFATANRFDDDPQSVLYTQTICERHPQIFAWLELLDMNVIVIIILMLCVSGFNIISGLIILILDSIRMIGTLKALGADNSFIRRIFITQSAMLIGKGMVLGNIIGLALCAIEHFTHIIPLDPATYYISYVPVAFPIGWLLLLNIGIVLVSLLILLAPSAIVTRISPAKVMHFE